MIAHLNHRWMNWLIWGATLLIVITFTSIALNYARVAQFHVGWIEQTITKDYLEQGEPLRFKIRVYKHGEHCQAFTVRVITNHNGEAVWNETTRLADDEFTRDDTLDITIPISLPPGHYKYRADIHISCEGGQFITGTPLYDFTIGEPK